MSERVEGKIALEEHFYLPSFETFERTARRSIGPARRRTTFRTFSLPSRSGSATTSCGSRRWIGAALS
jgi:hypothetical protein